MQADSLPSEPPGKLHLYTELRIMRTLKDSMVLKCPVKTVSSQKFDISDINTNIKMGRREREERDTQCLSIVKKKNST